MARPKKNNADYFTHDSDMRNDVRIKAVRRKYKLTGYAIWNFILEVLTDSDYFEIEWTDLSKELLSADFDVEVTDLTEVVDYCVVLGLLQLEDNKLYSKTHQDRFKTLINKRQRDVIRVIASENPTETSQKTVITSENTHSKGEKSKVKESKVKESKVNNINPPIIPPNGGTGESIENWRNSYDVYISELKEAYTLAVNDQKWMAQREKFHPSLNIKRSLNKAYTDFWGTEAGWHHKKSERKTKIINWRTTLANALTLRANQVYREKNE